MSNGVDGQVILEIDAAAERMRESNLSYQRELVGLMERLNQAQHRTEELQTLARGLLPELEAAPELTIDAPSIKMPSLPWFKHFHGQDLPPNPDAIARDEYLAAIRYTPWTAAERKKLKREVENENHSALTLDPHRRGHDVVALLRSTDPKFFTESKDNLNWDRIALAMDRRSANECRLQWLHHDHPLINKSKWSPDEVTRLAEIAEGRGCRDWPATASELGTGRTPADCVRQYRAIGRLQPAKWSAETDAKLLSLVSQYGQNWQTVARALGPGWSSNQCIDRWLKRVKPEIKRGPWSDSEDALLRAAVESVAQGFNYWKRVSGRVANGRTDAQCRERWTSTLDPKLLPWHVWAEEEDEKLRKLREDDRLGWAEIADKFNRTRTDNHCMKRYQLISDPAALAKYNDKQAKAKKRKLEPAKSKSKGASDEMDVDQLPEESLIPEHMPARKKAARKPVKKAPVPSTAPPLPVAPPSPEVDLNLRRSSRTRKLKTPFSELVG